MALSEISKLFSARILTNEIRGYLKEIITNDKTTDKKELSIRMEKFIPFLLERQFYTKNIDFPKQIINGCLANFYGFWYIISHLDQKRNLIPENQKENFATILGLFGNKQIEINLSYQDLSGCNLRNINFNGSDLSFGNYQNCNMSFCDFESSIIQQADFNNSNLNNCFMSNIYLNNSNFAYANLNFTVFFDVNFDNNIFTQANFGGTFWYKCILEKQDFGRCHIFETNFSRCDGFNFNTFRNHFSDSYFIYNGKIIGKYKEHNESENKNPKLSGSINTNTKIRNKRK